MWSSHSVLCVLQQVLLTSCCLYKYIKISSTETLLHWHGQVSHYLLSQIISSHIMVWCPQNDLTGFNGWSRRFFFLFSWLDPKHVCIYIMLAPEICLCHEICNSKNHNNTQITFLMNIQGLPSHKMFILSILAHWFTDAGAFSYSSLKFLWVLIMFSVSHSYFKLFAHFVKRFLWLHLHALK